MRCDFDNFFYDGKPYACAFIFFSIMKFLKYLKDAIFIFRLEAYAVIGNVMWQ